MTPPLDWEPMPREARTFKHQPGLSVLVSVWVEPFKTLIESGQAEIEYRVVNHRGPDSRNRFWWRASGGRAPELPFEHTEPEAAA